MTRPRGIVSASLAERGRPELWANEAESAALSGMGAEHYAKHIESLEALGFPKPSVWNGKRFVPAIIEFWREQHGRTISPTAPPTDEERQKERFDNDRPDTRKRLSA